MNDPVNVVDPLVFVATSDLSGILRGKSFPLSEWTRRLRRGVGWTPTNVQITCFDTIAESPFGSFGDLALVPDPATRFTLDASDRAPRFDAVLGDIRTLEGEPWAFCTRAIARHALAELHAACGASALVAFEHEFEIDSAMPRGGDAFGLKGFRDAQPWAEALLMALRQARCQPDTFMKEFGPNKYEVTLKPQAGISGADHATLLRAITHDVLTRYGVTPSFSPILDPAGVGNGVHVHLSLFDDDDQPLSYDPADAHGMSTLMRHFVGGVLTHLDQILALLAPSAISYLRLTPHRWSAAFNNLGYRDREAAVRICPVSASDEDAVARQYNIEVRAVDAAACPHLALAAIVMAGTAGIRDSLVPPPPTEEDLSLLEPAALAERGFRRLPESLDAALDCFHGSDATRAWFGNDFVDLYTDHKRAELAFLAGVDDAERCRRYREVY